MKKVSIGMLVVALFINYNIIAQIGVSENGSDPDESAMLDVSSTDKGMLIPRMTQAEIEALPDPANGLTVFNTDNSRFYFYDEIDSHWKEIAIGAGIILPGCGTVTDVDGNTYSTIVIGTQCWMSENLATSKLNDNTDIQFVDEYHIWQNLSTPAYCYYDQDSVTYSETYGALYNWYTVNTGLLCPAGWHVPTVSELDTLVSYLGGTYGNGGKLKETGFTHWNSPNTGATNETGFTALPGGRCASYNGWFYDEGNEGTYWSSTQSINSPDQARHLKLSFGSNNIQISGFLKGDGYSVRCIKD